MRRLEDHLRADRPPSGGHLVVRGSPNTAAKLLESGRRLASQYTYRDAPAFGSSVNVVVDLDELDRLLQTAAYLTRHHVRRGEVGSVTRAGFVLLATFSNPTHFTVLLDPYTEQRAIAFLAALAPEEPNPYYVGRRSG
jgi:hypothetical protein